MLPLAGLRIIAVEQYGAGPFGSMMLGDLGAEVIKIENPAEGGDVSRSRRARISSRRRRQPFLPGLQPQQEEPDAQPQAPRGAAASCTRWCAAADAMLDNLRGDQPEKLGVTYAQLREANPKIVCAHLSAYGREGSRKAWPGYDYLMQAEAGLSLRSPASRTARPRAWASPSST